MSDTPMGDAFLASRALADDWELSGMSAQDINRMSMTEYAKIRERAGLPGIDPFATAYSAYDAPSQEQPPAPVQEPQSAPQGLDLANMDMGTYAQIRGQLGVTGREYGAGITTSNAGTSDWVQAAQRKAGRSAMQGGNVTEGARPDSSKYLASSQPVTGRTSYYN